MPQFDFIIIDDNEIDIFIARKMILNKFPDANVLSFLKATEAYEYTKAAQNLAKKAIMFVDINMPLMDGFEFMELFEKLPAGIRNNFIPCFLTSSVNESDKAIAKTFSTSVGYINKPLTPVLIENLLNNL
ncbi:MAG: two-component system response regulator [Bacteroidia bacterium]